MVDYSRFGVWLKLPTTDHVEITITIDIVKGYAIRGITVEVFFDRVWICDIRVPKPEWIIGSPKLPQ